MARVNPVIKPATKNDVINIYGMPMNSSMKGVSVFIDGQLSGIGGIYYTKFNVMAFAHIKPLLRKYPVTIWRCAMKIKELIEASNAPVYSIADPKIEKSDDLLMKMGFRFINKTHQGDLYEWIG